MKIYRSSIAKNEYKTFEEVVSFKEVREPLLSLKNINVLARAFNDGNMINISFSIKGNATVACAFTLEPTDYKLDFTTSVDITDDEKNEDAYIIKGNMIDLDPIIMDLIICEVPTRVVKTGAKKKIEGEGYRVLSEADLKKEKEEEYNPKFDKLKDVKL